MSPSVERLPLRGYVARGLTLEFDGQQWNGVKPLTDGEATACVLVEQQWRPSLSASISEPLPH